MPIETWELFDRLNKAAGPKRIANALGVALGSVYRWGRHPMDADQPDGTGAANPLDRLEMLVEVLAMRPNARPVLIELQLWTKHLFARSLGQWQHQPMTDEKRVGKAARCLREFADFIEAAGEGELDPERLHKEAGEAIDAIEALTYGISRDWVRDRDEEATPSIRRAI